MFYHLQSPFTSIIFRKILADLCAVVDLMAHFTGSGFGATVGGKPSACSPFHSPSQLKKSPGNFKNDPISLCLEISAMRGGKTRETCTECDPEIVLPCGNTKQLHPQTYTSSLRNDLNPTQFDLDSKLKFSYLECWIRTGQTEINSYIDSFIFSKVISMTDNFKDISSR